MQQKQSSKWLQNYFVFQIGEFVAKRNKFNKMNETWNDDVEMTGINFECKPRRKIIFLAEFFFYIAAAYSKA